MLQIPHAMVIPGTNVLVDDVPSFTGPEAWSRLFQSRLDMLDEQTRRVLLTAAASGSERAALILTASNEHGLASLEIAEDSGLLRLDGSTVRFTHPLLRTAVYAEASPSQRRTVHRALAAVTVGTERAWHLAAASAAPNDEAADALEASANEALARRAPWLAADSFVRSAALTPDGGPRTARLAKAAEAAQSAGRGEYAAELARTVITTSTVASEQLDALMVASVGLSLTGHGMDAAELERLVEEVADANPAKATFSMAFLGSWRFYQFQFDAARRDFERAEAISGVHLPECHAILHAAAGNRAAARLALVDPGDGRAALPTGWKWRAILMEDHAELIARIAVEDTVERMDSGEYAAVPLDRLLTGWVAFHEGRLTDAMSLLDDAHAISALTGQRITELLAVTMRARLLATTGDTERARRDLTPLCHPDTSGPQSVPWFIVLAAQAALGFVELTTGNLDLALSALRRAEALAGTHQTRDPSFAPWAFDLIEVLTRSGDRAGARSVAQWIRQSAELSGSLSAASLAVCAAAMLTDAPGEDFDSLFAESLEIDAKSPRPFMSARIEFQWGVRLHRENRRREARTHLTAAVEAFDALGSPDWAARARTELTAAGGRRRDIGPSDALTSQELEVAQRAATGLTVKRIAAELFLSPKTVEWHLSSAYRKLDVHTRIALAAALREAERS